MITKREKKQKRLRQKGYVSAAAERFTDERLRVSGTRIEAFGVFTEAFGDDLAILVGLLRAGDLDPQVGWRGDWERVHEAADALRERRLNGKAVLDITSEGAAR